MPNSLLWVCLVAIWLFVLVPMVVKSRPAVRKTSHTALSTRVLHRGGRTMTKTTRRMASGRHPHDAEWEPPVREYRKAPTAVAVKEADTATAVDETEKVDDVPEVESPPVMKRVAVQAESDEPEGVVDADDTAEVDVVEDDSEGVADSEVAEVKGVAEVDADAELDDDLEDDAEYDQDAEYDDDLEDDHDDEYGDDAEYGDDLDDDDDAELVAQDETDRRSGRGGFDPEADRERSDKRYRFRQRVMAVLAVLVLVGIGAGAMLGTLGWAVAAVVGVVLVGYMAFLRRAVRSETRIRRQRMQRLARARRQQEERQAHPEVDPRADIPRRLRRPGAIVLEIDDEDPVFDHLPRYEHVERAAPGPSYRRVVGQ